MNRLSYHICKPFYDALNINFEKNKEQLDVLENDKERFPFIIGGERGGKSFVTAALLLPHVILLPDIRPERFYDEKGRLKYATGKYVPSVPDFVLFGPTYAEPRIEFQYLENWLRELDEIDRISKPNVGPWRMITKSGVVITTWSTDDPTSIRGLDLEGAALCEAGNMDYDSVLRAQGRVSAKKGFIIYSGTMENAKRWYIKMALEGVRQNKWGIKTFSIPTWSNLHEFPGGRLDPEIIRLEKLYPEDVFLVRVAAIPTPPRNRVISEIKEEHIKKVSMPRHENGEIAAHIELAIDPGYLPSAYAVLWVASWDTPEGKFWYIFDEIYEQRKMNTEIISMIKNHKFYKYLMANDLTIDVSAKRHSDGNEPAIAQYQKLTKLKFPYTKYWHEKALIERIRVTAKSNMIAIHPNCVGLIAELGLGEEVFEDMHPWRYSSDKSGIITSEKPEDSWNHSCKALGYLLLRHLGLVERLTPKKASKNRIYDDIGARNGNRLS